MKTIAAKLRSNEMAVFEALVTNARTGLKRPEIIAASGVPRMTVRRILERFESDGVVVSMGKQPGSKAEVFRLNSADKEVVSIARRVLDHALAMNAEDRSRAKQDELKAKQAKPAHLIVPCVRHIPKQSLTHTWRPGEFALPIGA